jgi:hypothetical protein
MALSSLAVYGVLLAGWASNSKYAFLVSLRSVALMVSYELGFGAILLSICLFLTDSTGMKSLNFADAAPFVQTALLPLLLIFLIYFKERKHLESSKYSSLFSFMLLFLALNLAFFSTIPQFGRFYRNSLLFLYAFLFLFFSENNLHQQKWVKNFMPIYTAAALFWLIVEIRIAFDSLSIDTVLLNPIVAAIARFNIPVIDLIK